MLKYMEDTQKVTLISLSEMSESPITKAVPIDVKEYKKIIEESVTRSRQPNRRRQNPHYLSNAELYNEVVACKEAGVMSDRLCLMLQLMCDNIASRWNFFGYTYIDECKGAAMLNLVTKWDRFDHEKYTNAFAYYTQCILHSFSLILRIEKNERDKRDLLLLEQGMNPSLTFQMDNEDSDYY